MTKKIFFSLCFIAILLEAAPARPDFKICSKRNGNVPKPGTFCQGYYACKNFIPTEQTCQEGEHFNTNKGRCDSEDKFPCLEKPKFKECPTANGYYLKPGTNCEIYYDCCNGKPTEKRCRQGTFFDPSKRKCEWSSLYTCIEKPKNKKCLTRNGKFLKPGTNCRKYYKCKNGEPEEEQCQRNFLFNPASETCESLNDYTCVEKPERKECPTRNGRFLRPGTNCRKYYDCINGEPNIKKCPPDTLFNPETGQCESSRQYVCVESISTTEKVLSTIVTMFTSFPSTDDQNEKTSEETSLPTSSVQQTTTSIRNTYPTLDPDFEKTDTEEFISITESASTESHSTVSSTSTYSTIYPDTEKTSSGDLEISTVVTSNEDHSTTSNEITYSTLDPGSEKTNSENIEVSTEMSSEPTPTEIQWTSLETRESTPISPPTTSLPSSTQVTDDPFSTLDPGSEKTNSEDIEVSTEMSSESTPTEVQSTSLATRENTSISPPTTSLPSSTHATDDPISKEDREFPITESTVYETTISSMYSTTTKLSTTAAITDEVTSTQQVTTIETKIPEITSTIGETTTPDVESNFMCPEPNGYFPHPTDKHKFVGCTNNIPAVLTCPGNLIYKHKLRRCDYQ
ncbi:uncharacterized protein TNIN_373511 [Trichonephila inaurata madagascariensis]|uniref:Chitin-binding type-2 domain-containing protein n=1 Tax=Trichonephila inaurata madagascariensis TaxID=2747483 RepID=A0A8X6XIN0_9ARAC|nr:uncharacterized protein TNIN_373511 [Trichonephila inaurata madagascariensis]